MPYSILSQTSGQKIARPSATAASVEKVVEILARHRAVCRNVPEDLARKAGRSARQSYEAYGRAIGLLLENAGTDEPVMQIGDVRFYVFLQP